MMGKEKSIIETMFHLLDFVTSANFGRDIIIETSLYNKIEEDMKDYTTSPNMSFYSTNFYDKNGVSKEGLMPHIILAKGRRIFIIFQSVTERVFDATPESLKRYELTYSK